MVRAALNVLVRRLFQHLLNHAEPAAEQSHCWLSLLAPQATTPVLPLPAEPPAAPAPKPCGLDATGKYHVGCGVTAPRLVYHVEPQFSTEARDKKFMGNVLVALTVGTDGNPENVHVFRSAAEGTDKQHRQVALSLRPKSSRREFPDCRREKYRFATSHIPRQASSRRLNCPSQLSKSSKPAIASPPLIPDSCIPGTPHSSAAALENSSPDPPPTSTRPAP